MVYRNYVDLEKQFIFDFKTAKQCEYDCSICHYYYWLLFNRATFHGRHRLGGIHKRTKGLPMEHLEVDETGYF